MRLPKIFSKFVEAVLDTHGLRREEPKPALPVFTVAESKPVYNEFDEVFDELHLWED